MKYRYKAFSLSMVFIVAMALVLIGCGSTTTNSTAETDGNKSSGMPRVAFVYSGPPGDGGFTYSHELGRKYMEEKLGIKATTVESVPEGADAERVITELAQNHDIVFTTSFSYMEYTVNVAKKFPKVIFINAGGYKTSENMGTYNGRTFEASYLVGVAAGKMTKKNLIGFIGAHPIPEVIYNVNAFALGAQSVNPDVKVNVVWSNTWFDPARERQAATSLIDKGVDFLLALQDSPATVQLAAERGVFAGGDAADMNRYGPEIYVTNPVWNWGDYFVSVVEQVKNGTWKGGHHVGSMKDGLVGLAPFGKNVPEDVKKLVEDKKQELLAGKLTIFKGPLKDQSGAVVVEDGKELSMEEAMAMKYLVQGIEGTIPK
jgi:basic membrane protein A